MVIEKDNDLTKLLFDNSERNTYSEIIYPMNKIFCLSYGWLDAEYGNFQDIFFFKVNSADNYFKTRV